MKTLRIHRAPRMDDGQTKQQSLTLIFTKPMPGPVGRRFVDWDTQMRARFIREGSALEEALFEILPGGTYEYLLGQMLTRKAKLHVTSFAPPKPLKKENLRTWLEKRKPPARKPTAAKRRKRPLVK